MILVDRVKPVVYKLQESMLRSFGILQILSHKREENISEFEKRHATLRKKGSEIANNGFGFAKSFSKTFFKKMKR